MRSHNANSPAISFQAIQNRQADFTFFFKDKVRRVNQFISSTAQELYHSLSLTFSANQLDSYQFKKLIWPIISSGAAFIVGELATRGLSQAYASSAEYEDVFKFILGTAILGYSALNRLTEKRITDAAQLSGAVAAEVVAITYLYLATFRTSHRLLAEHSQNYALISSLGISGLAFPGAFSYLVKKAQEKLIQAQYKKGAQRQDSAMLVSGLTPLANIYFQANHFLMNEMIVGSRLFQLGLIADNIQNHSEWLKRLRNLPALMVDAIPSIIKKLIAQQEKMANDYHHNTSVQTVLKFTANRPRFFRIKRCDLRDGDLVACDNTFNQEAAPVSGELIAFTFDDHHQLTPFPQEKKFSVNLKAHNGEDVWIELTSKSALTSPYREVDLHAIHEGKQAGVLAGDKLNLYQADNFFVQIKAEKDTHLMSGYEKKALINQIINQHKQKKVMHAILFSLITAPFLAGNIKDAPAMMLRLLFNLFQMMIPFSETFLREMVNGRLMNEINRHLPQMTMETIDALRVVDFCNALAGYYRDKFPNGVAIISDKTGTLTTSKMDVLGLWTDEMAPDVLKIPHASNALILPGSVAQTRCFATFVCAFTNSKKELEPEEFAILQLFNSLFSNHELQIGTRGNNHFIKTYFLSDEKKTVETFHLGLYRSFGGRFTLVDEGEHKYLVFCGIPKCEKFAETALFNAYTKMQPRKGVLSRDWCIAQTSLTEETFLLLKHFFTNDDKKEIEKFLNQNKKILSGFHHFCTFIINNPLKKAAETFIAKCKTAKVPVFIATGDTARAAENIAEVLCPDSAEQRIIIRATDKMNLLSHSGLAKTTVIFAGVDDEQFALFAALLQKPMDARPAIIFAEMSTEEKGRLAQFLKNNRYFVVANGDGTNDIAMMKTANLVIAHLCEAGHYAPMVEQFANLNDHQLQQMIDENKSFYELFDIDHPQSLFLQTFAPLANSQEKPSMALLLKTSKMGFELANVTGIVKAKEMLHQHWYSVAFDLLWLWISFHAINHSTHLPADNRHLGASRFATHCMIASLGIAFLQAVTTYALYGESTNLTCMLLMLSFLPLVLQSIFSAFGEVQNEVANPNFANVSHPTMPARSSRWQLFSLFCKEEDNSKNSSMSSLEIEKKKKWF